MLDKYFNYKKHKTDFKTEVIAGVSTFLTMAYILFLNPVILADGGFDDVSGEERVHHLPGRHPVRHGRARQGRLRALREPPQMLPRGCAPNIG